MGLDTSEFGRALEAVSDGRQTLDSLLTILTREDQLGTAERAARRKLVQDLRESGRLSEVASDKVMRTIFKSPNPPGSSMPSGPPGSHPSNWSNWAENQPAAPPLTAGCVLRDRFVLEEVIGSGGMSIVFRALDRRREEALDRQPHVAIKVLGDEFKRHPDALRALQRESRKTQRLAHPNIASVYDFDRDGANVYMVMELLVGEPLDELLRRRGRLGLERVEALRILAEMGAALSHAHQHDIVHSDFKPSNAFVTQNGETKVIDFGVARATKPKTPDTLTALTMFDAGKLGAVTVAYCSPEQMLGDADPDPRDDIYALGVVAYELLAGRHPFGGRSALDAQLKGVELEPVVGLTAGQNAALRAALERRREQRTASVDELLEGLGIHTLASMRAVAHGTAPRDLPHVMVDETRLRGPRAATIGELRHAAPAPAPESRWRTPVLTGMLLLTIVGGGYYGFQQWQRSANEKLASQLRATEEAQRGRVAAEAQIERERLARQKDEEERLAAEAKRKSEAKARAKAASAKTAAGSVAAAPGATAGDAELQRVLAAEEAEQARSGASAGTAPAGHPPAGTPGSSPGQAPVAAATQTPPKPGAEAAKRTLYRWQDETGKVRYGVDVPEEFKDSAVIMLPGD